MTIERTGIWSGFEITCDICEASEIIDRDHDDFLGAVKEAKELGWKCVHTGDAWEHYCQACVDKGIKP